MHNTYTLIQKSGCFFLALLLWCIFILLGTRLFMSTPVFSFLNINPVALDFFNDTISLKTFTETPIEKFLFSPSEINHFIDVKKIVIFINHVLLGTLPLIVLAYFKTPCMLRKCAFYSIIISFSLCTIFIALFVLGYWKPFTACLHTLVFPDGNWKFSTQSLTISLYPRWLMQFGTAFSFSFAFISSLGVHFLTIKKKDVT